MAKKTTKKKQTKKPPKQTAQRAKKTAAKPRKATPRNATKPQKKQTKKPTKQTASKKAKKTASKPQKATPQQAANPIVGKIGWCEGSILGLDRAHYVFIRSVDGDKCSVNTFTSLKDKRGLYVIPKIKQVEDGTVYAIPKKDLTLPLFSGVHKSVIKDIPLSDVKNIGAYSLDKKHHDYINKNMNQ